MSHRLIHSPDQIKTFARLFLPQQDGQALITSLIARRKYCPGLLIDKSCLIDSIVEGSVVPTATMAVLQEKFYRSILKFETPIGSYVNLDTNEPIPNQALAIYVDLEPKDTIKAMHLILGTAIDELSKGKRLNAFTAYKKKLKSTNASGCRKLCQLDLDTKDPEQLLPIKELLIETQVKPYILMIIETRGGYHLVFEKGDGINHQKLHEYIRQTKYTKLDVNGQEYTDTVLSITSHPSVILPGTYQGDFPASICSNFFD